MSPNVASSHKVTCKHSRAPAAGTPTAEFSSFRFKSHLAVDTRVKHHRNVCVRLKRQMAGRRGKGGGVRKGQKAGALVSKSGIRTDQWRVETNDLQCDVRALMSAE